MKTAFLYRDPRYRDGFERRPDRLGSALSSYNGRRTAANDAPDKPEPGVG